MECLAHLPLGLRVASRYGGAVFLILRIIGVFNAALWLGSALFFTFGVAPAVFSPEMKRIFGDYYTGVIAQNLIGRFFAVNLICAVIALIHFVAEMMYAGRQFRRFTFVLLLTILSLGLLGSYVFRPRIESLHQAKYRGPVAEQPAARQQLSRLHAVSMIANVITLFGIIIYTWQVTNPPAATRFVSQHKFRG